MVPDYWNVLYTLRIELYSLAAKWIFKRLFGETLAQKRKLIR